MREIKLKYILMVIGATVIMTGCSKLSDLDLSFSAFEAEVSVDGNTVFDTKEGDNETDKINLVLSKYFEEENQNADNNELVAIAEQFLEDNPDLGTKGKINFIYTAYNYTEDDQFYAVFLLVNRTEEDINDMSFDLTWTYGDESVYDSVPVTYEAENANTLPPDSAIIFLTPVDEDKIDLVKSMEDPDEIEVLLENAVLYR